MAYPSVLVSVIITEAQVLLNDSSGALYPTATLLPFVKKAWRELQNRFIKLGRLPSSRVRATPITITALVTEYPAGSIPTDFLEPLDLEERAVGSSDLYTPMVQRDWEPNLEQSPSLQFWTWRDDVIKFLGATADRSVRLYYAKFFTVIADATTALPIPYAQTFLAARTAALASFYIGANSSRSNELNSDAGEALEEIVGIQVSHMQGMTFKRKPYGYRRAMRRMIY